MTEDEEEGTGDTDRTIGGGGKLPAVKDVPVVEMTVEAEGAFIRCATDTRDGEVTTIDGEGASVYNGMARPDSDGAPLKAKEKPLKIKALPLIATERRPKQMAT